MSLLATRSFLPFVGVSLISGLTLLLEVLLTRILSISQGYHYAFFVVSLALLGIGVSGTVLSLLRPRIQKWFSYPLVFLPALYGLSLLLNYGVLTHFFIDRYELSLNILSWIKLGLFIVSLALPFFFSGLILGIIYTFRGSSVGAYYASDLAGASLGALLFLPLGFYLPPHELYGLMIAVTLLPGTLFAIEAGLKRLAWLTGGTSCLGLLILIQFPLAPFKSSPYKPLSLALLMPESKNIMTLWNAYSQINIVDSPTVRYAPGLGLTFTDNLPEQRGLTIDGGNLNAVTYWDGGKKEDLRFIPFLPSSSAYKGITPSKVLIINAAGGLNILEALYWGTKKIDVIEANPLIRKAAAATFDFSPYEHSTVAVYEEDPRYFLSRSKESYDLIVISLSENPAPASTGLHGLSENYLMTLEAFESMKNHLSEEGMVTLTRYSFIPPREEPRLTEILTALLTDSKDKIKDHIIWIKSWGTSTLLFKKSPFSQEERRRIGAFCHALGFEIATQKFTAPQKREYLFDISVPTDNRPYFDQFIRLSRLPQLLDILKGRWNIILEGGLIVWIVLGFSIIFCLTFILVPLLLRKERTEDEFKGKGILVYFLLLGVGFISVEMALIHRSILLFTHPSYAISTGLFIILFSSAAGSFYFHRCELKAEFPFRMMGILVFLCLVFFISFPFLLKLILPLPMLIRFVILFGAFFPLGFLMGIPFSYGIRSLTTTSKQLIPWAWGINATSSVIGSILAVIVSMQWGYSILFLMSSLSYALCFIFLPSLSRGLGPTKPQRYIFD